MSDHNEQDLAARAAARLQAVIGFAVAGLTAGDRESRIRWCEETGTHGVRANFNDDGTIVLVWGNSRLAVIDKSVLFDADPKFEPVFMREYDTVVPPEWLDGDE